MNHLKSQWYKLTHWEYWPMEAIYYPIFPLWAYFAIRARSFFFFNAANPSIKNGGMAMESKKEIYDIIPSQFIPKTLLVKENSSLKEILPKIHKAGIKFPLIAKPDIGMKALGVEKLENSIELISYLQKSSKDILIQELIVYPNEIGLFYVRFPDEKRGRITGIVYKEFLSVIGNGKDSIEQLIKQNPRSSLQLVSLWKMHGNLLNKVLVKDETFVLVPYGSHTRGSKFTDVSHKINDQLLETINMICTQIPGFYFGRLDIRYNSFEELSKGNNFSIIEINGAGSEPTHIYDPGHSLFFAWREIFKHWKLLYEISVINKRKGHNYLSYKEGTAMLKANSALETKLKLI
ncbi:D-alanine--D-alanine ligase [Flavobacteriaceae bacterium KMM 6898]|nr:D-alanine--D-alanine ligase [Flavobacteriaceae bacterium KMM 6898]